MCTSNRRSATRALARGCSTPRSLTRASTMPPRPRRSAWIWPATDSAPAERIEQGPELALGLVELGLGLRVGDDAGAGEQAGHRARDLRAPQRDRPFAVAVRVHPADRSRVPAALDRLEILERLPGGLARRPAHRGRGVERGDELERRDRRVV